MSTLLLRLAAPLQSWGIDSKFDIRKTQREPTKSGVTGMLAAALGRKRTEPVDDLRALRFGVRVDREGVLLRDFHMVHGIKLKTPCVTTRYYLSDAVFLVGLEGEDALLARIETALRRPAFPLSLGRRSCPPEGRLCLGIRDGVSLCDALRAEPLLVKPDAKARRLSASQSNGERRENSVALRAIVDNVQGRESAGYLLRDQPKSYDHAMRKYDFRFVSEFTIVKRIEFDDVGAAYPLATEHDPMRELGG